MSTASPQYVTIATAAERLSVSEKSVRRWISQGELPAVRVAGRLIRIPADALADLGRPLQVRAGR
ncbi:MAG: helix-turn-helix domain-containing protein [Microcella pacifica]|uniref:Excisionase family DNA-binding protein n=1 Tax=Microcella pacifica TaxID=2591847 RepID=A0A9E5JWQ4_9MICO|nr:helix-turn-helix domain-containing protein [Microcella pacifica]NHF63748.1 excisionase family DNA-binding protein [Microcella pacifica]